jgi:sugar/nucleoside kinase (ribokinase family)
MAHDALVLGTLCEDLFPAFASEPRLQPGALFEIGALRAQPGGCVANTGFALAELGTATALAADVGDDALGELLIGHIDQRGADAALIRRVPGRSTSYSVVVEGAADRCIWHHRGANAHFDGQRLNAVPAGVVHAGYPSLLDRFAADRGAALVRLFEQHKRDGSTTSLDLAVVDGSDGVAAVDWMSWLGNVLPHTDVFAPSVDDLRSVGAVGVGARGDVAGLARLLLEMGAAVVVLKDSTAGITLLSAGRARLQAAGDALAEDAVEWADLSLWMPALDVSELSTAGAGDAAVAGLLHGIAQGLGPEDALRCAAAASAARVEGGGAIPRWEALRARLDNGWTVRPAVPPPGCDVVTVAHARFDSTAVTGA